MSSSEDQITFRTAVVGVDGRDGGRDAIALATTLLGPGGRLILTSIVRPRRAARLSALFADADRRGAAQMLSDEQQRLDVPSSTVVMVCSSIAAGLHAAVESQGADLLVVGSAHRGPIGRVMLGDDARQTLTGAHCAVAVASHGMVSAPAWHAIAVGDDGSPESDDALAVARGLAARTGARIRDCAVVGPGSLTYQELSRIDHSEAIVRRSLEEQKRLQARAGVHPEVLDGEPGEALAELGHEVDLIVIGSQAKGPLGRLLVGSTGTYLARHAPCPVLIMPRGREAAPAPGAPSPDLRVPAGAAPGPSSPGH